MALRASGAGLVSVVGRLALLAICCLVTAEGKGRNSKRGASSGGPGDCKFTCSDGIKPRPREGHKPTFNGCGVPGFQVESPLMTECCNQHDICFHTCQLGKKGGQQFCDREFDACMKVVCNKVTGSQKQDCEGERNMMNLGVSMAGCQFFQDSQAEACDCQLTEAEQKVDSLSTEEKLAMLIAFYAKHNPDKTEDQVKSLLDKFKKRAGFIEMMRELESKYDEHPVVYAGSTAPKEL